MQRYNMSQRANAWKDYRQRRRLLLGATLVGVAIFSYCFHLARVRHAVSPFYVGLAVLVGLIAWGTTPLAEFPCPNCGEAFHHRGRTRNLLTRKCLHCQHRKYQA